MKTHLKRLALFILGTAIGWLLVGCAAYQSTVASRSDSLAGYAKDSGSYGGAFTHTVTYR